MISPGHAGGHAGFHEGGHAGGHEGGGGKRGRWCQKKRRLDAPRSEGTVQLKASTRPMLRSGTGDNVSIMAGDTDPIYSTHELSPVSSPVSLLNAFTLIVKPAPNTAEGPPGCE